MANTDKNAVATATKGVFDNFTDRQLFGELLARGYTGTLTRVVTLSAEPNNQ